MYIFGNISLTKINRMKAGYSHFCGLFLATDSPSGYLSPSQAVTDSPAAYVLYHLLRSTTVNEANTSSLPFFSIPLVILLLFVGFIFFEANAQSEKQLICNQGAGTQDSECVVAKDGHQICGSAGIRDLCRQITIGFYLLLMGLVLMVVSQV